MEKLKWRSSLATSCHNLFYPFGGYPQVAIWIGKLLINQWIWRYPMFGQTHLPFKVTYIMYYIMWIWSITILKIGRWIINHRSLNGPWLPVRKLLKNQRLLAGSARAATSQQDPDWELKLRDGRRVLRLSVRKVGRMGQVVMKPGGFGSKIWRNSSSHLDGKPTGAGCFGEFLGILVVYQPNPTKSKRNRASKVGQKWFSTPLLNPTARDGDFPWL